MSADFWAGYISGAIGIVVGNPLDLLKTRLQAGSPDVHATSASSLRTNFDSAGTLLRGATAPILTYGALNALLFTTYNRSLTLFDPLSTPSNPSQSLSKIWLAGAAGGLATFVVSAPTELIKCRAQVARSHDSFSSASAAVHSPVSSWGIARTIFRNEGIRGLYYGGVITSIRDSVGYGFYFYTYELSRRLLSSPGDDESGAKWKVLLYGGIAGVVTWASIFPLDVVKTRVQTQDYPYAAAPRRPSSASSLLGEEGRAPLSPGRTGRGHTVDKPVDRRRGAIAIARQAYREQGLAVFFRGLGLCTVRGFIVSAVQFFVYEWVMELLNQGRRSRTL